MTISISTDAVHTFCDTLSGTVLTDALTKFKNESNDHFMTEKVKTMSGQILTNHVNHLDNFKKLQGNDLVSLENEKNTGKSGKDNDKLGTIQEEFQDTSNNDDSSDEEDVSSLTSDSDNDSDASLSNSTEEEVEYFPAKKVNNNIHSQPDSITSSKPTSSEVSNSKNKDAKNNHDVTVRNGHGEVNEDNSEKSNQVIQTPNKQPRKLAPLGVGNYGNKQKPVEPDHVDGHSMLSSGLQSIPTTSDDYDGQMASGSSDVIIPSSHNPPDLIKGNLNSSGTVSDDSDLKDHARILAELQKIVQDDEEHDGGKGDQSNDGTSDGHNVGEDDVNDSSQNKLIGKSDGGSGGMVTSTGDHNELNGDLPHTSGVTTTNNGTKSGFHSDHEHDGHHVGHADISSASLDGTHSKTNHGKDNQSKLNHDGAMKDGTKLDGKNSEDTVLNGHVNNSGSTSKNDQQKSDGEVSGIQTSTNIKAKASNNQPKTPDSPNASFQTPSPQPTNFTVPDHTLENLERKLSNLQISNTEQTAEIGRLKALNKSLKEKFEKLEQTSSYHQNIEERMLQRNEELEKHLLGMLKSQEIIFDMKENLKATSADNKKLTKDYKEAVKALEAVDKLFGQKDALVNKWKEATEESRQLVELLKKHNAEVGDLETVDKLKEEIAQLKDKVSKAEERSRTVDAKNEELIEQSRTWKEKYERENEQAIKFNFQLQEVTKEIKNHQKLAGKRGRKNQMLQLEITELKDKLKLAKEKLTENERRLKDLERKHADTQEMYTKIIHEKEKQHSVLIKNSESYQKDLVSNIENAENLRKETESLKGNIVSLEKEKGEITEKLKDNEKSLEENLNKKMELSEQLAKLQSDFEASKIEAVDNELYTEEQAVRLQELEEQCQQLQHVLKQYIHSNGSPRNRRPSTAPNRYSRGKKLRSSQTWPSQLDMYRQLLSPPRGMPRRKSSTRREARYKVHIADKNNDSEDMLDDVTQKFDESSKRISSLHPNRPRSTYGNRSLSAKKDEHFHHDREHSGKDWVPKIVLVDSQKLESSSEHDSGSVSADQYAMQYVKFGDRVLFELAVDGKKQNIPGTVKYVGPVYHSNFKSGIYAGLKLDIPAGDTNGTVGERIYFRCLKNHGKFVKLSHILAVQNPRTQQYTRVLPMAYQ